MEYLLCSEDYRIFREQILKSINSPKELFEVISSALDSIARKLNAGFIGCGLMAPTTPLAPNGENNTLTLFHNRELLPQLPVKSDIVQVTSTGENGFFTFIAHPVQGHTFTEEEKNAIKLIGLDCFILGGRARLIGMVQKAATTDLMTGADNQPGFMQFAGKLQAQKKLKDYVGLFINLKNFKYINRSMGAQVGDTALKMYVNMAKAQLKEDENIGRLGGDNFFVLIHREKSEEFINRFSNLPINLSIGPKPLSFKLQARMGVYQVKENDTISDLMHNSSIALNVAKSVHKVDVMYFTNDMLINAIHHREISTEFHNAIREKEFIVYYQPKVNLITKELCGSEALVRWLRHKTIVPPMDFVPILEQEGTICNLDFYVLNQVCSDIAQWISEGIDPVRISVNFSKHHLTNPNFAEKILGTMTKYGINSKYIEVELTEVSDYDDSLAMQKFVNTMRENGISVSIDDFGTGYSTLNVLKNFNVNVIKLDKSLLDNIGKDESQDEVVVKNVVNMAREMNKEVIAEGVESEIQAKFLKEINCTNVQGYLFDKPLKPDDFKKRLTKEYVY